MPDIVERLRFKTGQHVSIVDTMSEAADEIERLRKLLAATERDLGRALFALEHHMKERGD
jgi:hypothetical protein